MSDTQLIDVLQAGVQELGLDLSAHQQKQLLSYLALIAKWNKIYNLTAIRDEEGMLTHHLLDSLAVVAPLKKHFMQLGGSSEGNSGGKAPQTNIQKAYRLLDVGAGAGLPGIVIAICCPDVSVSCVDAVGKKAAFIQQVAHTLELVNLRGIHARVEHMLPSDVLGGFDVITSRAFATLNDFVDLTKALLVPATGVWMAMKAKTVDVEVQSLPKNVGVFHVERLVVPGLNEDRCLVWIQKN